MAAESYAYQHYYTGQTAVRKPLPEVEVQPKQKTKAKAKVKSKVWNRLLAVAVFAMVFCIVYRYTIINEMAATNTAMQKQLQEITAANEQAAIYLDKTTDLKKVEEVARNELNMDFPQSYQIVNVTLNHENKVVKTTPVELSFFDKVKNAISKTLEYLY